VTVIVIVGAAVAGVALNTRRQEAGASSAPTAIAVRGSPTTANLAPDEGRDLVVNLGGHGIGIRTEAAPAPFFKGTSRTQYAVSPNGKLAYWKTGADDALPHELHVYDTATRTDRTLLTLTDERGGSSGFMVWSTDGTGIAFGTSDPRSAFEGRLAPARPTLATWWLLDVGSGLRRKVATISDAWFRPVSWDRLTDTATASEVGRDPTNAPTRLFYVWDPQNVPAKASLKLLPVAIDPLTIWADGAASSAVGLEPYGAPGFTGQNIWTWPLRDPTVALPRKIPGRLVLQALFRPGTTNVYALMRDNVAPSSPGPPAIVDLGPLAGAGAREVYRTLNGGDYVFFRSDGSAMVVGVSSDLRDRRGAFVDPDTGASVAFAIDDDVLSSIGPPPKTVAAPSPTPTPMPNASGTPFPTQAPPGFATAEEAADAAKRALEGDPQLLRRLIRPAGWYAQWFEQGKTDPMSLNDAWGWLTLYPDAKRTVDARPIVPTNAQHPTGEAYVTSQWLDFGGYPEQKADIMLGREGGRWYWTSVLLYRPPPIGAFPDTFNGYATLQSVTDATITVKFRAVGSRCCSDPSWNGRTVTLRRDRTTWMRAGGVVVPAFEATGAVVGSDVWVQFAPSTLAADGTYRLSDFSKMYP